MGALLKGYENFQNIKKYKIWKKWIKDMVGRTEEKKLLQSLLKEDEEKE